MTTSTVKRQLLCRGNRTEVLIFPRDGATFVEKRLLSFADVKTERRGLYYEGLLQRAARGPGVVPIRDTRFEPVDQLSDKGFEPAEAQSIERAYIQGHDLKEFLSGPLQERLSPDRSRAWIATLMSILSRVHALRSVEGTPLRIVHRDVTLGNVLIGADAVAEEPREGNVWLNDFGIAYVGAWGPLALEETLQGSRRFLAPELKAGEQPTAASDVYQGTLLLAALLNAEQSSPIERLFDVGFSNPASAYARSLLKPWGAEDGLSDNPAERPDASELAALLLA